MALQPRGSLLPVAEMGAHQGFPEPAVVGHTEVQEFMHDHLVPDAGGEAEQLCALRKGGLPAFQAHHRGIGAEHGAVWQAEATGAVEDSPAPLAEGPDLQARAEERVAAPVSSPVGLRRIRWPSVASSSTASGLALHTRANSSGVSRSVGGSTRTAVGAMVISPSVNLGRTINRGRPHRLAPAPAERPARTN